MQTVYFIKNVCFLFLKCLLNQARVKASVMEEGCGTVGDHNISPWTQKIRRETDRVDQPYTCIHSDRQTIYVYIPLPGSHRLQASRTVLPTNCTHSVINILNLGDDTKVKVMKFGYGKHLEHFSPKQSIRYQNYS